MPYAYEPYVAPYLPGSAHAPVPGWGTNPALTARTRVGVGAMFAQSAARQTPLQVPSSPSTVSLAPASKNLLNALLSTGSGTQQQQTVAPPDESKIPWWYYAAGAVVLGGVAYAVYKMV